MIVKKIPNIWCDFNAPVATAGADAGAGAIAGAGAGAISDIKAGTDDISGATDGTVILSDIVYNNNKIFL